MKCFFSDFPLQLNLYKNKFFHRYFCTYAAVTVTLSFLMVVSFFVAIMTYDVRRIKSGPRDSTQKSIKQLTNILTENEYYQNRSLSWMDTFSQYAKMSKKNITGSEFLRELKQFLQIPTFSYYKQDLRLSKDGKKIEASRVIGFMKSSSSSTFHKNAMLTLREDIEKKTNLEAFPIVRYFIFFEMYAIVTKETIRNLIISALAVFIVTSPFLADCAVTLLVVLNFTALVCELFGLMVIWDVALNSVSMINLVMAIGFAVDYSAHIAHAYITSKKATANERVVDALTTLGASVFMGGRSGAQLLTLNVMF